MIDTLKQAGYPTDILTLDFETYFDQEYSLKKMSIIEYITDDRFEFTGVGVKVNDRRTMFVPGAIVPLMVKRLQLAFGKGLHNVTLVVANDKFDVTILAEKFGIYPPYVIDIQNLARYYDSRMKHSVKDLATMFGLQSKGDTNQFKGQHQHEIDIDAMHEYCANDVDIEYKLFHLLMDYLDNPEVELPLMQHTLNLYLQSPFDLDADLAREIKDGMESELKGDLAKVDWVLDYATKKKTAVPDILRARNIFPKILADILPDGEQVPMKQGKKEVIPALAQEDVAFQLLLTHPDEKVRNLCKAKAACTSWPLHQAKVESLIAQAGCSGGKVRVPLTYYSAHTGRPGGTQGVNLLNLGGKGRGKPIHPLIGKVRNALLAPEGKTLLICDSAQIEARETAWMAGQNDLVEDFANGKDVYSIFGTKVFGEEVRKSRPDDPDGVKQTLDIRRGFAKDTILGRQYGLGTDTAYQRCLQNETLRPMFESGEYDWNFVDRLTKAYRSTYSKIPGLWKALEKCFRWVTKYPKEISEYTIPGHDEPTLRFWRDGTTTIIQLPSDRRLYYRHAKINLKTKELSYKWGKLYGAMLVENVIQSICRDLLVGWLFECERNDIPIILYPYDELVGCVPENKAEEKLEQMLQIMNTGPRWAAGLPLDTEGEISKCYKK